MSDPRIATSAEQPINRHAGLADYEGEEGDLVGLDADGNVVKADADGAAPVPALGVLLSPVDHPDNYVVDIVQSTIEANRTVSGRDRVTFVRNGIEVENADEDWGFTPGERVYLDVGGDFTQTAPSTAGDLVQVVGVALTPERIFLDVQPDYETA